MRQNSRTSRTRILTAALAGLAALLVTGCTAGPTGAPNSGPYAPEYRDGGEGFRPEVDPRDEPDSTFAIDIDTASYGFARRQILDGNRVDPDTVRPEEFINSFRQDYPQPEGDGFSVTVDGARWPSTMSDAVDGEYHLLRVGLQTRSVDPSARSDAALTFVVDVSGSMAEPGRLDLVQDALHYLIDELRESDYVAIVAYEAEARVLRDMTPVSNRAALHGAVDDLAPGGSTNLEAGLVTGYRVARDGFVEGASNRVILLSDGLANVGNTEADPILEQIREEASKQIALLGVGVGSEYGDALMERLADEGDGFVTYVAERDEARRLFVDRLPATIVVRALDAKVQVSFDQSTVEGYRLVGYDNRVLDSEDFDNDRVDGGEVGPGHSVTALYVVRLQAGASGHVATARVRWLDPVTREASETPVGISVSDIDRSFASASPRLWVTYAAGFFAEVLRGSPYGVNIRLSELAEIAEDAFTETDDQQVEELADLIRRVAEFDR